MFFFTYLRRELTRRKGRTFLTVAGLAIGVTLVVAITAVSGGLDAAQSRVLNPLASVGTDLLVTRPVQATSTSGTGSGTAGANGSSAPNGGGFQFGGGGGGGGGLGGLSPQDQQALISENASVLTDLSKLGKPGDHFVHDFFLPATQLTFPSDQTAAVAKLPGVAAVSEGLTLLAQHQEGTVPQIVAEIQTGGEQIQVDQQITPPTPQEEAKIQACIAAAQAKAGTSGGTTGSSGSRTGGQTGTTAGTGTTGGTGGIGEAGPGAGGGERGFGGALRQCLPDRFQRFRGSVTTPQRTLRQVLNPPQTDIQSATYTIAGVDPAHADLGLLTPAQVTSGAFLSPAAGTHEAVLADAYASRKNLKVGDKLTLNGTEFTVVGLAQPPLGGQAADVYVSLENLRSLSNRAGRANVLLVRAQKAADVAALAKSIEVAFPGATVTSAKELAANISGSLVDAGNLARRLGGVLAIVVMISAFLVAALLTLSSVNKRVRELGTLKAIGWRQGLVVRQVVAESAVQGLIGGVLGAGLGVGAAALATHLAPALKATAAAASGPATGFFGLGQVATGPISRTIPLSAPVHGGLVAAALGLAILGGLLAGTAGALRAARLRPADALRELG
jgi:putative ABC transport system permease protein